ncbi:hypothetical protein BX666DRAFT_1885570 [Dichotomocladium elegans]|nr:hypothetical protein BX666DRAFT_1885570 [Dichotomocladium elegans]
MVSTNTTSSGNAFWPRPISLANFSPGLPLRVPSYSNPSSAFPSWMLGQPSPITFTTNSANARPRRKHARKNSWYTLRHHHHHHHHHRRHSSADGSQHMARSPMMAHEKMAQGTSDVLDDMALQKKSSNKLLCLWPLPIVTRCVIALSLIVSAMNFWGAIELSCSSPSYVIYRLEVGNLLLSPFFIAKSLHSLLLFGWNILILGLFEESLAHILGGTRPFVEVLVSIVLGVCTARQGIGYVFSKSTGFAVPRLFFSDSLHECSQGLAPFLFALLVIESLSIEDKYILMIGSNVKITVRKFVLQLVMLLVNYMVKNILWWSLTGLLIGSIVMVIIKTCLAWHPRAIDVDGALDEENDAATIIDGNVDFVYVRRRARTPLWREMWAAIKNGMMVVSITLLLLILFNAYYTRETYVDPTTLNSMTHDRYMFTFVVMTAPRRGDPPYLSRTLDSYLANWPVDPEAGSLYDRTQAIVYTHFTNHTEFDLAKARFSNDLRGQQYLKWVRQDGNTFDQRLHVSKALSLAADNFQSTYVALIEDDFPICGENEWRQMQNVIYAANQRVPGHCGVFVGTGGR